MQDPAEIPFSELIAALLDTDTPLHPRFLYRLSDLGPEEMAQLEQVWPGVPLWRRRALLEDLEELGDADTVLSFEPIGRYAVRDEDAGVRRSAVRLLWQSESEDLIRVFDGFLSKDPDSGVRTAAAAGLGQFVYKGELEELPQDKLRHIEERLMRATREDSEAAVRRQALESLSYSSRPEVPALIERAFTSGDRDWVASALVSMGRSADKRWKDEVLPRLDDPSPRLRSEAARASGELEISEAVPQLIELTEDGDEAVRLAAIWALSQVGGRRARRTLESLLSQSQDEDEVEYLETALDNLAFTEGLQPFSWLDFPEDEAESEMLDLLTDEDEYIEFDDDGDEYPATDEDEKDQIDFRDIEDILDEGEEPLD